MSCEKIARVLPAFKPQWDAARAPSSSTPPTRSSGLKLDEFEGPRYQRIAHIKKLLNEGIIDIGLRAGPGAAAKPVAEAGGVKQRHPVQAPRCQRGAEGTGPMHLEGIATERM